MAAMKKMTKPPRYPMTSRTKGPVGTATPPPPGETRMATPRQKHETYMPAPTPSPSASGRSTDLPWVMAATCVKKSGAPLPKASSVAPATSSLSRSQAEKLPTAGAKNCSADSVSAAKTTICRRGTRVSARFCSEKRSKGGYVPSRETTRGWRAARSGAWRPPRSSAAAGLRARRRGQRESVGAAARGTVRVASCCADARRGCVAVRAVQWRACTHS